MIKNYLTKLIVAFCFVFFWQNTNAQVNPNQDELQNLRASILSNRLTVEQAKQLAEEKGWEYRIDTETSNSILVGGTTHPIYLTTTNQNSAISQKVTSVVQGGVLGLNLTGANVPLGIWDGGSVRDTHQEFVGGGLLNSGDTGSTSNHATHVAGTMVASGINAEAKGMSPAANLLSYDFNNNLVEMTDEMLNGDMILSNHSYGFGTGWVRGTWVGDPTVDANEDYKFGFYSDDSEALDALANLSQHHLFVVSAGNTRGGSGNGPQEPNGGADGFDCLPHGNSTAKNTLVVAAVEDVLDYNGPSSVGMSSFSSWGPTDDGRIKPDISANGVSLISTSNSGDTAYTVLSGTSMAAPSVTGALALMQEHYFDKNNEYLTGPETKALAIHGASEAGVAPGPDYAYGWGLLNAENMASIITNDGLSTRIISGSLFDGAEQTYTFQAKAGNEFKVTLVWYDKAGEPLYDVVGTNFAPANDPSLLNNRQIMLVNDLDLRVENNGTTYSPWVLDVENPNNPATRGDNIVDTVEQIVETNLDGTVTVRVSHKGEIDGLIQNYAIIVTGIPQNKDAALVDISPTVPENEINGTTTFNATVKNVGLDNLDNLVVNIEATDPSGNVVFTNSYPIASIAVDNEASVSFDLDIDDVFKSYTIKATVTVADDLITTNNVLVDSFNSVIVDLTEGGSLFNQTFDFDINPSLASYGYGVTSEPSSASEWIIDNFNVPGTNGNVLISFPAGSQADTWAFTNPYILEAGASYRVKFRLRKNSLNPVREDNVEVSVGTAPNEAAMTTLISSYTFDQAVDPSWLEFEYEFTATSSGTHHFGIHHFTGTTGWLVAFDDFEVFNLEAGIPSPDFSHTASEFALENGITTFEDVTMVNNTYSNPDNATYTWEFTPNTVTFINGTSATSEAPQLRFNATGTYEVKLIAQNSFGSREVIKTDYFNIIEPTLEVEFTEDRQTVNVGENVAFEGTSNANPAPDGYIWQITPNTGWELLNNTTTADQHINVLFTETGTYSVRYIVSGPQGLNQDYRENLITVTDLEQSQPTNFNGVLNGDTVNITWDKPGSGYTKSFDVLSGWYQIDANNDGNVWTIRDTNTSGNGAYASIFSWNAGTRYQTDDYLISPRFSEVASLETAFSFTSDQQSSFFADNLEVFYVKAPSDGSDLTPDYIQTNGISLYDDAGPDNWTTTNMDISAYVDGSEYHIVFYSNNFNQWELRIDDFALGPNPVNSARVSNDKKDVQSKEDMFTVDGLAEIYTGPVNSKKASGSESKSITPFPQWVPTNTFPVAPVSYRILRNGVTIAQDIPFETTSLSDILTQPDLYSYIIIAKYPDGSEAIFGSEQIFNLDATTLSVTSFDLSEFRVYPNPAKSNGELSLVLPSNTVNTDVQINLYNMLGAVVSKRTLRTTSSTPKVQVGNLKSGIYVMEITADGKSATKKLVIE